MSRPQRVNLQELLKRRAYEFGIVTTYTFDPVFFEQYCLQAATLSGTSRLNALGITTGHRLPQAATSAGASAAAER
jgi:hypothetical protein